MSPSLVHHSTSQQVTHRYRIDGIEMSPCNVEIIFQDDQFHRANFPFHGHYDAAQWRILGLIASEIDRLSNQ